MQVHTAVYLFGAVCPERDAAFGLVLPVVSTDVMQTFLDQTGHKLVGLVLPDNAVGVPRVRVSALLSVNQRFDAGRAARWSAWGQLWRRGGASRLG